MMRTVRVRLSGVLLALALCTTTAIAQNVHFVRGPFFTDVGTQLVASGKLAGLGEGDITIVLDAQGIASVECRNPGGNIAPGQDTTVNASGSVTLGAAKNGHLNFSVTTAHPSVPNTPTCPNQAWSAEVLDVAFSGGTITVLQGGQVVLQQTF